MKYQFTCYENDINISSCTLKCTKVSLDCNCFVLVQYKPECRH